MKRIINGLKLIRNTIVACLAAFTWPRRWLNAWYLRLIPSRRSAFHREFAKIFRNSAIRGGDGFWVVTFAGRDIRIPLTAGQYWIDWDTALTVVGQDIDVRQTYENLLNSPARPELFVDIGANYGTHSLLFLVQGIVTMSFEPNNACHDYFRRLAEANQVMPRIEPVALGEEHGAVTLSYPQRDTWLGSISAGVAANLSSTQELITEEVELKTLDDYLAEIGSKRTLIKIDTEGHELSVLRGAIRVLQENRPIIIFECWKDLQRTELFDFLDANSYQICQLPWRPASDIPPLTESEFLVNSSTNFITVPIGATRPSTGS